MSEVSSSPSKECQQAHICQASCQQGHQNIIKVHTTTPANMESTSEVSLQTQECQQAHILQATCQQGHQNISKVSSTPSLSISNLTCLRWTDKGQAQILKIREKISPRWEEAGDLLGLTTERLKLIDMHRRGDVGMCCRDVLVDWLHENQGSYSATWEGVVQLLEDMNLSAAAQQLKNALL